MPFSFNSMPIGYHKLMGPGESPFWAAHDQAHGEAVLVWDYAPPLLSLLVSRCGYMDKGGVPEVDSTKTGNLPPIAQRVSKRSLHCPCPLLPLLLLCPHRSPAFRLAIFCVTSRRSTNLQQSPESRRKARRSGCEESLRLFRGRQLRSDFLPAKVLWTFPEL